MRRVATLLVLAAGCGAPAASTTVTGDAFAFNEGVDARVSGAHVFVLEDPSLEATTDATGHFSIANVPVGSDVTLVLEHDDFIPIQTGTHQVPATGIDRITFQAVRPVIRDALAGLLSLELDPTRCQMVTTVTRVGRSLYDPGAHGEAGVTVTVDPPLPAESGPIYFNSEVLPDRMQTETSDDGGVLFVNVPVGEYTLTAHQEGGTYEPLRMTCTAGRLVNASPPWGLQRL
ncbi:MAG: hypothetical protein IT374_13970 [Polyangiaceae bacterium]|nr:hypothetical protein [Polyangiaceae bacterium]